MSLVNFYATQNDLLDLLMDLESKRDICYAEAGMFDNDRVIVYRKAFDIPNLSIVDVSRNSRMILVGNADINFLPQTVPQRRGGVKFALDQEENPDTLLLLPGGQIDSQTVAAGRFGTCTGSAISSILFRELRGVAMQKWNKIKLYVVGPQAEKILDAGGKLTPGLRPEYDLRR